MWVSGCGTACEVCSLRNKGRCTGCSRTVEHARNCWIFTCLDAKGYGNCLECRDHLGCGKRFKAMASCIVGRRAREAALKAKANGGGK